MLHSLKALIVDDNPSDRRVISAQVKSLGVLEVQTAENGSIAEGKIHIAQDIHEPFQLLLVDWNMPRTSGLKLLRYIRSDKKLSDAKVIIMTGTPEQRVVQEAISSGADDFLVKPIQKESLKTKIEKLFGTN